VRLLAFARSLLARWDRRVATPRPLGLVFRQSPSAPRRARAASARLLQTHVRRDVHVDLQPRIELTVVRPTAGAHTRTVRETASAGATLERLEAVHELVLRNTSVLAAERLLERALTRSRRVEVLVRPGPAGRLPAAEPSGVPPALVVQRAAAPERSERAETHREPWPFEEPRPRPPAPADVDVGHLTDRVVAAIDHRLTAHAERLGRP
jgi:hypothetical protein